MKARLLSLLRERSFERKQVILASGRKSDFFVDCKQTVLTSEGHRLIGELMLETALSLGTCHAVAGVALGGCPLASAVSLTSRLHDKDLPALYVRKAQKDHGSAKLIEGDRAVFDGMSVVLLEDVITTGGSSLSAVSVLEGAKIQVRGIVALVDRLEGGREAIEAAGYRLTALFTRNDFIPPS